MPKTRPRKRYTEDQRATILSVAQREGLTATEVKKRFGVTPVTYYSWRKKTGVAGRRGQAIRVAGGTPLSRARYVPRCAAGCGRSFQPSSAAR